MDMPLYMKISPLIMNHDFLAKAEAFRVYLSNITS